MRTCCMPINDCNWSNEASAIERVTSPSNTLACSMHVWNNSHTSPTCRRRVETRVVDREQLRIAGLTGVDITLDIAGAGSRSYAFVIDWHIRLLLALAWLGTAWLWVRIYGSVVAPRVSSSRLMSLLVAAPALVIYLFYHPLLEVLMRGRTPGKRMAGVRIVMRNGATPGIGALLIRNIFRLVDSLPFFYVVGLGSCLITEQKVRIGDLAAGTVLVRHSEAAATTLAQLGSMVTHSGLAPVLVELMHDLLERWDSLAAGKRDELARSILAQVDGTAPAAELAALSDRQLLQRLRELLASGPASRVTGEHT